MMRYGGSDVTLSANVVLQSSLTPDNRCISKQIAIQSEASEDAMTQWEYTQSAKNYVPFPSNRLMPPQAVINKDSYEPFAELYDDRLLEIAYDRGSVKYDSFKAGYSYELTYVTFNDSYSQSLYGSAPIAITNSDKSEETDAVLGSCTAYTKGWAKVIVRNVSSYPEDGYDAEYWASDDGYTNINIVGYMDYVDNDFYTNIGEDRSVTLSFRATPLDSIPSGINRVKPANTHLEFDTVFYHNGQSTVSTSWAEYPIAETSTMTLTHTSSQPLDIAVTLDGLSTNGTYWDSEGWHAVSQTSPFRGAINVSKSGNTSTVSINWQLIQNIANQDNNAATIPIYIYGCWDTMSVGNSSDQHLVGNYNGSTTLSVTGMNSRSITVKSAGNLNKTEDAQTVQKYYTCMYKILWANTGPNIKIMPLSSADQTLIANNGNIGGTYGLIYPTNGFVRPSNQNEELRNYIGNASVVNNNSSNVIISSTINESPANYIVTQYFPSGSDNINETYTINGTSLSKDGSYTVNPSGNTSTLNINFGNIPAGSVRWLTLQQVDSREYANLSFTFNE